MKQVTIQYSHPAEDSEFAAGLRQRGLIPLLVNGEFLAATTQEHMAQALDMTRARQAEDTASENLRYRNNLLAAMLEGVEKGPDTQDFPNDALLLFIEGVTLHGYETATDMPFCTVRFREDAVEEPVLEVRPEANQ
ncbi:MAG: hypothetical protein H2040_02625 [Euryhalocaulis sp.]|uniref:hypothetical protein n=1 Tax=Euryhalocaulis sp. TaxID=2744307 RepID=UPI0017ADB8DF|nr:hypothetical protein [Euryhalocaulis sp.]MBA4800734.1 hypothetical protein [Euryhalocaulis sp.]